MRLEGPRTSRRVCTSLWIRVSVAHGSIARTLCWNCWMLLTTAGAFRGAYVVIDKRGGRLGEVCRRRGGRSVPEDGPEYEHCANREDGGAHRIRNEATGGLWLIHDNSRCVYLDEYREACRRREGEARGVVCTAPATPKPFSGCRCCRSIEFGGVGGARYETGFSSMLPQTSTCFMLSEKKEKDKGSQWSYLYQLGKGKLN